MTMFGRLICQYPTILFSPGHLSEAEVGIAPGSEPISLPEISETGGDQISGVFASSNQNPVQ